ncbi:transporter [Brunnivagina elsteri CCALA 953]|uniref:Transporter n=2 Tax=Brunnivagina TaxID=3344733 RepID=A0A2A2TDQ7_9CYAN|nr:transporter [Calothrix elsteri CCALA 953]
MQVKEPKLGFLNFVASPTNAWTNVLNSIYVAQEPNLQQQIVYKNTYDPKVINQQVEIGFADDVRAVFNPTSKTSSNFANFNPVDTTWFVIKHPTPITSLFGQYLAETDKNNSLTNIRWYGLGTRTQESQNQNASAVTIAINDSKILSPANLQQLKLPNKKPQTQLPTTSQFSAKEEGRTLLTNIPQNKETTNPPAKPVVPPTTTGEKLPSYLNSNPNQLQFPTKPEEVRLQGTQPITLNQTLEAARRNNKQLQVSLLQLERSRAGLREAQAALLPTLSLDATINRGQSASSQLSNEAAARQGINRGVDEPSTSFSSDAQLNYSLYTSGQRQATIRQAEEQVRVSEFTVEQQSEDIRQSVTKQYYNLQQADEQVRISQSAVTNAEASLRDALALEKAGVGTRFDVLRFQVNKANSQQNLTNARSQQQIERRRLVAILSVPQTVNLSAADPVKIAGLWNQSLEQSIIQALQNRPELQQQLAQRNISEQQRRQALSQLGPQINLIASYNLLDQFNDTIPVTDGYSVGVRASLNLYDGGASRARAAQASKNVQIAETNFAGQRSQIRFEVEQAYSQLQSNLENVQTANTALEQAREALRLARLRFQAGVGTQTDVIAAENDLTQSEGNRITAILDYNRALADIQRAVTIRGTQ